MRHTLERRALDLAASRTQQESKSPGEEGIKGKTWWTWWRERVRCNAYGIDPIVGKGRV
jgi:hypothetical protein